MPAVADMTCPHCGSTDFAPGFIEDMGQSSQGYARWVEGELERGIFGGARRMGRQRWQVDAQRCAGCGGLQLFAARPV